MGVASRCGYQEVGVASGSGWNLWVCLVGVVVRRYIDFLILLLYLLFFAAASLLFVLFFLMFFVLVYIYVVGYDKTYHFAQKVIFRYAAK